MESMTEHSFRSLDEVPVDQRVRVCKLRGGKDFVSRMTALGFEEGAEVHVIQNSGYGPLIALVQESRITLGRGEAVKVLVEAK